jgi:hypothetical protein
VKPIAKRTILTALAETTRVSNPEKAVIVVPNPAWPVEEIERDAHAVLADNPTFAAEDYTVERAGNGVRITLKGQK